MKRYCKEKNCLIKRTAINKISLILSVILAVTATLGGCSVKDDFDIRCVYLDAGQGDSTLITTSEGYTVMIDTGAPGSTDKVVSSLLACNTEKIDLLILTHFHEDHVAGTLDILERFDVTKLWCLKSADNYITDSIVNTAKDQNTKIVYAAEGDSLTLGKSIFLNIDVLCTGTEGGTGDENENSLIIRASYLDFSALFMADAGHKTEQYLLENRVEAIKCDILKVGHHGSDSSSSEEFIKAADPQIAVISCEKNNPYGHPHKLTLDVLKKYCEYTVYTYDGNFEVLVKGAEISFKRN